MRYVKYSVIAVLILVVAGFLHYTLPQRDIVRIVGVENRRIDNASNSLFWSQPDTGTQPGETRDVRFINTIRADGDEMVYRNEDTGWGWPPYFKVNTSNLQTRAQDLISTAANPKWVVVRHYGWRNEFFSIYPNAVGLRQIDSPDITLIPWLNIVILSLMAAGILWIRALWRRFWRRMVAPAIDDATDTWDRIDDSADAARDRARGFWSRVRDFIAGRR
jgi:hypothetical protein